METEENLTKEQKEYIVNDSYFIALSLMKAGLPGNAELVCVRALNLDPYQLQLRVVLAQAYAVQGKKEEAAKYKDYFDFSEPIYKVPSHRILAVLRGFLEGFLRIAIAPAEEDALYDIEEKYITGSLNSSVEQVKKAIKDAYKRLLQPSIETETRNIAKEKADIEASKGLYAPLFFDGILNIISLPYFSRSLSASFLSLS